MGNRGGEWGRGIGEARQDMEKEWKGKEGTGSNAMRNGKNVLHYTFELTESAVGIRYDSNLCNIPSSDVRDNKERVQQFYKDNEDLGRLIIKEYPTGAASVTTIRNHIEKLALRNFKPSIILIDYADIMRSSRKYDSLRHELKLIYEELRNLAMDMNIPIWTASQANRDSANHGVRLKAKKDVYSEGSKQKQLLAKGS